MLELRSCKQSSLPFNQPPPTKWQKAPQCGKSLAGSSLALLISIWQHVGSLWLNVVPSVNTFLLDGFPALPLQSCVAGDESPPSLTLQLHFLSLALSIFSQEAPNWLHIKKIHPYKVIRLAIWLLGINLISVKDYGSFIGSVIPFQYMMTLNDSNIVLFPGGSGVIIAAISQEHAIFCFDWFEPLDN